MFRKGDTVVHPEHGAAVIEELRDREFLGEKRKYLVLRVAYGDLTLMVPVDSTEELGEGRLAVTLRVSDPRWLVLLALRLAPAVTVVEPPHLRAVVVRTARTTLDHYGVLTADTQGHGVA